MNWKKHIPPWWQELVKEEFESDYFRQLEAFLAKEKTRYRIFPPENQIFAALHHTPPEAVKAVIVGQDPYHGQGQANGLAFSVAPGVKTPPSLRNILKELVADLGLMLPFGGSLEKWAKNGVLLLNATLTVREKTPGSHQNQGWETFTDNLIRKISAEKSNVVFLLWGNFAQSKEKLIDTNKHHILKAAHPSPFSAHNGFLGCRHFSKTNQILKQNNIEPIDWQL